jgi:hypothetical protein
VEISTRRRAAVGRIPKEISGKKTKITEKKCT